MVIVASLALGIGASTAIFSFVNAALLRPLPVAEPERLVAMYSVDRNDPGFLPLSRPNFEDFRKQSDVFSVLAATRPIHVTLLIGGEPERVQGEIVSASYFDLLGVRTAPGRGFLPEEDRPGRSPIVLGHGLWQRRFHADPDIIGRLLTVNGHGFTVVGVAVDGFRGLNALGAPELWVPMGSYQQVLFGPMRSRFDSRQSLIFYAVGRLRAGVSLKGAKASMDTLMRNLELAYPDANEGLGVDLLPLAQASLSPNSRPKYVLAAGLLLVVVAVLLLIACVNVANLLLARSLARRRELAIRMALGASRPGLTRQLVVENLLLSLWGGATGVALAWGFNKILWAIRPPFLTDKFQPELLDVRVLAFVLALSLSTGLIFGLFPLLQTIRFSVIGSLRDRGGFDGEGRWLPRLRDGLVLGQIALSLVTLVGSGLFLASLRNAERLDPGFESERMLLLSVDLGSQGYDGARAREFQRLALERVSALPGVASVAASERFLFDRAGLRRNLLPEGGGAEGIEDVLVGTNVVSESYFSTFGVRILDGRAFSAQDRKDTRRVAVVNETLAERFWPGQNPLGRRFRFATEAYADTVEVVGVARDADYVTLGEERQPYLYLAASQEDALSMTLLVRTLGSPQKAIPMVRRTMRALDPMLPILRTAIGSELLAESLWTPRLGASLLAFFALVSLTLSAIGIYGVTAHLVGLRRREIGIRLALGATRPAILRLVLRRSAIQLAGGLLLGGLIAGMTLQAVSRLLFGMRALDPVTFAVAALVMSVVTLISSYFPARRAMAVDPRITLAE